MSRSCDELRPILALLAGGEAAGEEETQALRHVEACAPCRAALDDLRALRRAFRGLPRHAAPPLVLVQPRRSWVPLAWAAAAAAVAFTLGMWIRPREPEREPGIAGGPAPPPAHRPHRPAAAAAPREPGPVPEDPEREPPREIAMKSAPADPPASDVPGAHAAIAHADAATAGDAVSFVCTRCGVFLGEKRLTNAEKRTGKILWRHADVERTREGWRHKDCGGDVVARPGGDP